MKIDLKSLTQSILSTLFGPGSDLVKDGTYTRPMSLSGATGASAGNEITVAVKLLMGAPASISHLRRTDAKEKVLIRASELSGITAPAAGDYIIETLTGIRREVINAVLDPTGQVWSFHTVRSLDEDWGDLTAHGSSEDWGDLAGASEVEERGALYE